MNPVGIAIICSVFTLATASGPSHNKIVMCVKFINSPALVHEFKVNGINQTKFATLIIDPDLSLCTHLVCSDTYIDSTTANFEWANDQREQYENCVNSRIKYPHLKILYSVKYTPNEYYEIISDAQRRIGFIKWVFIMVCRYDFDGLNLYWQHTTQKSSENRLEVIDRESPVLLLKELNELFQTNNLLLITTFTRKMITSYSSSFSHLSFLSMYDLVSISIYIDYMVYDEPVIIESELDQLINSELPSRKIIMRLSVEFVDSEQDTTSRPGGNQEVTKFTRFAMRIGFAGAYIDLSFKPSIFNNNKTTLRVINDAIYDEATAKYPVKKMFAKRSKPIRLPRRQRKRGTFNPFKMFERKIYS